MSAHLVPVPHRFDVIVVVPARDEEERIGACLRSIVRASDRAALVIGRLAVVVVADGCNDRTTDIARSVLAPRPMSLVAECDLGNVARVRALGVNLGRNLLESNASDRTWIASTDADTTVPGNWVLQHVAAARRGLRGVAGVVDVVAFDGLPAVAQQHFAETYTDLLPAEGGHPHVHAANLGVRLDAYDQAGGWGCLPCSEDRDLWTRLRQTGAIVESRTALRVVTSGRSVGRVAGGFAECLRRQVLDRGHDEPDDDRRKSA